MALIEQSIVYTSGNRQIDGFLVRPEGEGLLPGIVVIHEAFGLNEHIKDITRRFANIGYMALAVDLFSGCNIAMCMFRLISGMQFNSLNHVGIRDLRAGLTFFAEQPGLDSERLGAIGFCLGGSLAIAWASGDNRLKAIAPFYGMNPRPLKAIERMCPVVGSYPDKDFTASHAKKLDVELEHYHIPHDIKIYPDTKHSFFNNKGHTYNAAASEDAWTRILTFFQQHMGTKMPIE